MDAIKSRGEPTETGAESAKVFVSRHSDVDSEGCRHLVLQRWYLERGPASVDNKECVLYLRRKRPATKALLLFSVIEKQQSMISIDLKNATIASRHGGLCSINGMLDCKTPLAVAVSIDSQKLAT
jgi:hypothetical protein